MRLRLTYEVEPGGWASFRLLDARGGATVDASYLHDSLKDLIVAATALLEGHATAKATFVGEPSHVVMNLGPVVGGELPIRLIRYEDDPSSARDSAQELVSTRTTVTHLGREVASLAARLRAELGEAEYERRWQLAPFPGDALATLERRLASHD